MRADSESSTSHLADVVSRVVAAHIVPLVVSGNGEEGVMLLPKCETHLVVLVVVWLAVPPVEPLDGCVHVIPSPPPWLVLAVPTRGTSTEPEGGILPGRSCLKK